MKYKIGDWVFVYRQGVVKPGRIQRFSEWDESDHSIAWIEGTPEDGEYETTSQLRHVTVADAFELAGFPVPEWARINYAYDTDLELWAWEFFADDMYWRFNENALAWFEEQMCFLSPLTDLSRTPVSDCWDALPAVIREAIEGKVK